MSIMNFFKGEEGDNANMEKYVPNETDPYRLSGPLSTLVPDANINEGNVLEIIDKADLTKGEVSTLAEAFLNNDSLDGEDFDAIRQKVIVGIALVKPKKGEEVVI